MQANGGVAQELALSQKREKIKDKELQQVRKELQRKESALAEAAALLILILNTIPAYAPPDFTVPLLAIFDPIQPPT